MKLSTYIEECQKILEKYGDLDVIYASDDEGNDYNLVHHTPCVGEYENREFTLEAHFDEAEEYIDGVDGSETVNYTVNAVCIN